MSVPMCPGKEFGIMDTIFGLVEGAFFAFLYVVLDGKMPWWMIAFFAISTLAWFVWAGYCFRFATKCNCQEIYKNLGIK